MVQAVIFDFGGVLCFPPTTHQFASAARACGLSVDAFKAAFWANRPEYDTGLTSPEDYWQGIGRAAGREVDGPWIAAMVRHEIEFWSRYDDRVVAWISELRAHGFRTGILSNLPQPLGNHLRIDQRLLKHFDHITFSYELKVIKPEAAIYQHMIDGLGIKPEEGLFFDDRPENVAGARAAGLQAELFVSWEDLLENTPARYGLPAPAQVIQGVARPQ